MATRSMADWTCDYFMENQELCKSLLENIHELKEIPSLNSPFLHDIKDGHLVRFRGMIQNIYNPEFYLQTFEVRDNNTGEISVRSGMYRDAAVCQTHEEIIQDSDNKRITDRQTLSVISTPGLNEWATEKFSKNYSPTGEQSSRPSVKRSLDHDEDEPMDTSEPAQKKERSESNVNRVDAKFSLPENLQNFPIPIENGKTCVVNVYSDVTLRVNQVVDVVGFVSITPLLNEVDGRVEGSDGDGGPDSSPSLLIPRLHAVAITESYEDLPVEPSLRQLPRVEAIRSDLHKVFSKVLFDDDLAADFLIAHLLSKIYIRRNDLSLGNFPINITDFSVNKFPTFPRTIYNLISQIVSKSHYFLCTLENLNKGGLIPRKDYETGRLVSGTLQLSPNTHLVIDETKLTAGKLFQEGRKSYKAIDSLLTFQRVSYDFKFYSLEYETDIPVLILSEHKSFLPCMIQVPLHITPDGENQYSEGLQVLEDFLNNEERLNDARNYFKLLQAMDFQISADIADRVQADFVKLRKLDGRINADNLHALMVFARLMALSHGENSLSVDRWNDSFAKECERFERSRSRPH
ncbi:mini-chromosome maintenance complex-binding protein isoform X2 [Diachasmimorpha longicaudata]|uniref:mini-chromosome maintenance complex-binding protein isoform X2 n=1 Tax=Diachasmimorpha longicaudata TaxID=58733 RepID=UPI0030B8838D